jgi:hypothetical protein
MIFRNSKGQQFAIHKYAGCYQITNDPQTWDDDDEVDDDDDFFSIENDDDDDETYFGE